MVVEVSEPAREKACVRVAAVDATDPGEAGDLVTWPSVAVTMTAYVSVIIRK